MESGEQKLHNAARPTEPVYQMRYGAKQQTVFQMFHVKQDFFTERSCTVAIFPCMC